MADVDHLFLLAGSQSWQDRSRAGQGLVARIGESTVDAVVLQLLLDPKDTAVTTAVADALLARGDLASWRIFAHAWAIAAKMPTETNHIDHLVSCLNGALYMASLNLEIAENIKAIVDQLSVDGDDAVRSAAKELRNLVFEGL
ncbi:hypothetical protein ACIRSS_23370 [Amycolatopsis sp. NPDC101161]|uniref:hypothetical protein n=1 Tax=Amycolatopsis sp. NPDC101161 TaxID=3363940 RepID=UPI00381E44D6